MLAIQIFYLTISNPFGYERVYLPLHKVADTPFHMQEDDLKNQESDHQSLIC